MANDSIARALPTASLSASSPDTLAKVERVADLVRRVEQVGVVTEHVIHGGMYSRTVRLGAGIVATGTLMKVPTLLIVHGDLDMLAGNERIEIRGYGVLAGSVGRKALFVTLSEVQMTMVSATKAQTVEEAERELTDEHEQLMSLRSESDTILITGE